MRIGLVAGLPGSGKSRLLDAWKSEGAAIVDDPTSLGDLPEGPVPWLAIASCHFCRAETRRASQATLSARYPGALFEWTFFENDLRACRANVRRRADGRAVGPDMAALARDYVIPEGADVRPVFRPPPDPRGGEPA